VSDLYLRSVELSNFRIYGDSYAYELPDGPGVTLITGANGLGKTSFFDGVEWALTNRVNRFLDVPVDGRRKEPDPLTRIGAPTDSHRVSLQFSDGAPIDRGAGFVPNEASIARLLKRPGWADITNLHGYLSITHFLGQSSTQRFSFDVDEVRRIYAALQDFGAAHHHPQAARKARQDIRLETERFSSP
jgi:AAA domain